MLRFLLRRPPTIRVPLKNGPVDLQRVKIEQGPKPLYQRMLIAFVVGYCLSESATYILSSRDVSNSKVPKPDLDGVKKAGRPSLGDLANESKDGLQKRGAKRRGEEDEDSTDTDTIHFMLPIWFRQKKGAMYKHTDPEWKAFAQLQSDRKRMNEIKIQVMKMLHKQMNQPIHVTNLKFIGFSHKMGGMLEIIPPVYAPEVYEVPCLFISPSEIRFGWRALPDSIGAKMERIFHPIIFAQAFGQAFKVFSTSTFLITQARIADFWYGNNSTTVDVSISRKSAGDMKVEIQQNTRDETALKSKTFLGKLSDKEIDSFLPFLRGSYGDEVSRQRFRNLVRSMTYEAAIEEAAVFFRATWMTQYSALQKVPRGACAVRGFVDCHGERGRYRLEIQVNYLPMEDQILGRPKVLKAYVIPNLQARSPPNRMVAKAAVQKPEDRRPSVMPDRPDNDEHAPATKNDEK